MKNAEKSKIRHRLSMLENLVLRSCEEMKQLHDDLSKEDDSSKNSQIAYECLVSVSEAWTRISYARLKANELEALKKEKKQ